MSVPSGRPRDNGYARSVIKLTLTSAMGRAACSGKLHWLSDSEIVR
jgi:hypothetical protein